MLSCGSGRSTRGGACACGTWADRKLTAAHWPRGSHNTLATASATHNDSLQRTHTQQSTRHAVPSTQQPSHTPTVHTQYLSQRNDDTLLLCSVTPHTNHAPWNTRQRTTRRWCGSHTLASGQEQCRVWCLVSTVLNVMSSHGHAGITSNTSLTQRSHIHTEREMRGPITDTH